MEASKRSLKSAFFLSQPVCRRGVIFPALQPWNVLVRTGAGMTDSALDVTVTGPLARTNARVAAAEAGSSLSKVFDRKVQRAAAACQQQGLVFLPLAVETLGGMHKVEVRTAQAPGSSRGLPSRLR